VAVGDKQRAVVLGAGMVGSAIAWDMCNRGFDVTVVDAREEALTRVQKRCKASVLRADMSDARVVASTVEPFDIVLGALSSHMGLATLRAVIEARKSYVDISFMAEDAWQLDGLAKEKGVTAVVDCGVAPGVSNVLIGHAVSAMEVCERIEILVAGLPVIRRWPYEYKAPFDPHDVIEEYLRPSRVVENGSMVLKEALSEPELVDFEGVGTLEAFNTDGLRSLAYTLKVPNMREKTMRYPGHIALMRVLRETGFFSKTAVDVAGTSVRPVDLTAKLLFPKWTFDEREEDLTVLRVAVDGTQDGRRIRRRWDLFDRYDPHTDLRSMSRTTGFPAAVAAGILADGSFARPGVHPPEVLGLSHNGVEGLAPRFLRELAERGVSFRETVASIP